MNRRAAYTLGVAFFFVGCSFLSFSSIAQSAPPQNPQQPASEPEFSYAAQIPASFVHNLIFLPVQINGGKPSLFELDSTAAQTSIEPARAQELGLTVAGGVIQNAAMSMPGVRFGLKVLPVIARKNFAETTGQPAHGILGRDFFDHVVIVVDYLRQTVQVFDPATYKYEGQGKPFPITGTSPSALIRAKGNAGHKSFEADFELNTALDSAIVFYSSFTDSKQISAAHFKAISASYPELDEGSKILVGRLKDFQIGPYAVQEPVALFSQASSPTGGSKIAGQIGGDFLRRFSVTFDFPHQRVFLDPNLQVNHTAQEDMSGLSILAKGANLKTFEIVQVRPGTPGADAGLKEGDVIAGIDEEAAADLSLSAIRDLFRQVGHAYKLLIERQGQSLTITVTMRRLV
ncbi:MAG TPA: PDZ domain-containing protein [Candidatus Acidoferrales bacterium]